MQIYILGNEAADELRLPVVVTRLVATSDSKYCLRLIYVKNPENEIEPIIRRSQNKVLDMRSSYR